MAKKKSSNTFWYILGGVLLAFIIIAVFSSRAPDLDYDAYAYMDDQFEKPDAEHVLIEYSDFQCPYCAQVAPSLRAVKTEFDVHVEYRHYPLTQIHPYAQKAAEAAECARDQNRFWAYHDVLFANQQRLDDKSLKAYAKGLGLDTGQFNTCLDNRQKQIAVAEHVKAGNELGVTGTPTLVLDGEIVNYRTYQEFAVALSK